MTTAAASTTAAVAHELVALCRVGRNSDAIEKLYSKDIVSIEPVATPSFPLEMKGIDEVRRKNDWFETANEIHAVDVKGPFIGEDQFAVQYTFDITIKATGQRIQNTEMALYTVQDGKIVREQFFYHMPGA